MGYWEDRQLQRFQQSEQRIEDYYRELQEAFERAQDAVTDTVNRFFSRYAKDNKISLSEARKALSFKEMQKFKGSLAEYEQLARESIGTFSLEVENLSTKARITRYEALQAEIKAILAQLYDTDYEQKAGGALKDIYTDNRHRIQFDYDQYTGFHHNFAQVNTQLVESLLKYPFNGLDFSERIWRQNADLNVKLKQALTTAFVQGKNTYDLSKQFAKVFDVKRSEAYRLLNTEAAFIQGQATADGYKETGVEQYEICATLDSHTSEICREQDGKVYETAKMVVGVNYPPFHPHCRTTTVPVIEGYDKSKDTRIARDPSTSKAVEVPAGMTYREWKASLVEKYGAAEMEALQNKEKSESKDFAQYQKYKAAIGGQVPKTFANFQELKYNNTEEWERLKGYFRYCEKYPQAQIEHYDIYRELHSKGIKNGAILPPEKVTSYILKDPAAKDPYHIMKRMAERNITDDEVHSFVDGALAMSSQWNGTRKVFYSPGGVTVVTKLGDDWIAKTVWSKADFDEQMQTIMEVIEKYVKGNN
ncbi:minor capsid protein [Acetanaerobacterium elongatum]|uniref:Phage putative head morphogenesis protein, SPP1 gp7 family n=1 Tax=Acetanaerobacterium elongatum TaxID=258515 RepID=A0A1G9Z0J7_9FIRM|nr:minor capsid protein [Acetanaerobacterium elongatum]SDN14929.1 phage putative head morphogenesis protein, SPP1 gp7 family [Acetanaerobacterium elongatum]